MTLPSSVQVKLEGSQVVIQNTKHKVLYTLPQGLTISIEDKVLSVVAENGTFDNVALWGTTVRNLFHRIQGLDKPFSQVINLVGVGYKAQVQGKTIVFDLGFSHKVNYPLPASVECAVEKNTQLTLTSHDKDVLGQVVGELTKIRPPEPYKGKGVIKEGAYIRRKEGKKKNA